MQSTSPTRLGDSVADDASTSQGSASGKAVEEARPAEVVLKVDEVFGAIKAGGPDYRAVGWMGSSVLMMKTQIGLGVLSLPSVLVVLGIVPGILCLVGVAIITTWSDYVIGTFKRRHPEVYSIDDVGFLFAGPVGREIMATIFCIFTIMVVGSGLLSVSIAFNAITDHGTCTAVFVVVAAVVTFLLASIRTLGQISWLGWVGLISILAAIITLTVSVGVTNRPEDAPPTGPWDKNLIIFGNPTFLEAISAVSVLVFCYAGTPAFFGILSEMREPRLYNRAMLTAQAVITGVFVIIGVLVYFFVGQYISSPALGSAGILMKKVCYGLALPGLWTTCVLYSHLPAKFLFVRALRGSEHLTSNSFKHWAVWLSCTFGCVACSYVIASAVPVFNGLIGLIGALFGTLLNMQLMGFMWLFDNWARRKTDASLRYRALLGWNLLVIAIGSFLMVAGTYGSVVDIKNSYQANGGSTPFGCADNSQ